MRLNAESRSRGMFHRITLTELATLALGSMGGSGRVKMVAIW